jgi:predicted ribosomally synthesized peptide with nif11-like leader
MSIETVQKFYKLHDENSELKEKIKAITTWSEVIKLANFYGCDFTQQDINSFNQLHSQNQTQIQTESSPEINNPNKTSVYHYEFSLIDNPEWAEIALELENLKVKPSTVDIKSYNSSFRQEDLDTTALSPNSPEFQSRYQEINNSSSVDADSNIRQAHLINLDNHVNYPLYDSYFMSKLRLLSLLEAKFLGEVRFSGSFWYPSQGYRLWHTNQETPGWRMYIVDFDAPESQIAGKSFVRYMNPKTKEITSLADKPKLLRFFKIEKEQEDLFWHCIVNNTQANRWSFGFSIPNNWLDNVSLFL